jgi:hypothetical protein
VASYDRPAMYHDLHCIDYHMALILRRVGAMAIHALRARVNCRCVWCVRTFERIRRCTLASERTAQEVLATREVYKTLKACSVD